MHVEQIWNVKQDRKIRNGLIQTRAWGLSGSEVISELNEDSVGINSADSSFVCLFNESIVKDIRHKI